LGGKILLIEDLVYPVFSVNVGTHYIERGLIMAKYLISSKHEDADCLSALDAMLAKGTLDKFVYGCKSGDHTGYAIVEAKSLSDALAIVPDLLQETACVEKVDHFTPAEIKSLHAKAA
jgi:hypothetical protein